MQTNKPKLELNLLVCLIYMYLEVDDTIAVVYRLDILDLVGNNKWTYIFENGYSEHTQLQDTTLLQM